MRIGPYELPNNLILAPMAGITDHPFREICKRFGAGLTISEMTASNPMLRHHHRTLLKSDFDTPAKNSANGNKARAYNHLDI